MTIIIFYVFLFEMLVNWLKICALRMSTKWTRFYCEIKDSIFLTVSSSHFFCLFGICLPLSSISVNPAKIFYSIFFILWFSIELILAWT